MAFRFVHTADLHLDSPLRSLALRDEDLATLVAGATRVALTRIVDLCLEERVNALLIAGDLYDGSQTSIKTGVFLAEQLRRLDEAQIPVFIIRGNHDAEAKELTRQMALPDTVVVFDGRGGVRKLQAHGVAIHGVSFSKPHAPDSLLPKFRPAETGMRNIGMLHTSLAGAQGHDVYAPCSLSDLTGFGYDYWALGHVHKRQIHHTAPHVVMPGMPQGRDIGEAGPKSVTLVTMDAEGVRAEERITSFAEFAGLAVDVSRAETWPDLLRIVTDAFEGAGTAARSDHVIARLVLKGHTPLRWRIRRDLDVLQADIAERCAGGRVKLETLEDRTQTQPNAGTGEAEAADPIAELFGLMEGLMEDASFRREAHENLEQMVKAFTHEPELRDLFGKDETAQAEVLRRLMHEGALDVAAVLRAAGEG